MDRAAFKHGVDKRKQEMARSGPAYLVNGRAKNLYQELDKLELEAQCLYPKSPIICYESSARCYTNNPHLEEFEVKEYPNALCFQDEKRYEGWADWSKRYIIKDNNLAREIVQKSKDFVKKNKKQALELRQLDYVNIPSKEFTAALKKIDQILEAGYHLYIFFIDECFEIDDQELIEELPHIRMQLSEFVDEMHKSCDLVIKALAERYDLDWKISTYATFGEIIALLEGKMASEDFKKIKGRVIGFASLNNKFFTLKGDEAVGLRDYLYKNQPVARKTGEIKGTVVYPGKARGEVVILTENKYYNNPGEVFKGKSNFVLVTPMTRPEIVPYLKKASAIITNEGGITCHAAIIAREMKIPCLVGTKIATRVLKDGMRVEVDANKGIVKII